MGKYKEAISKHTESLKRYMLKQQGWSKRDIEEEIKADRLLYANRAFGKSKGIYSEYQFNRQSNTLNEVLSDYDPDSVAEQSVSDLDEIIWQELESGAIHLGATDTDLFLLRLRRQGLSYRDIARQCEETWHAEIINNHRTARNHIHKLALRIRNAYPYFGLVDIIAEACGVSKSEVRYYLRKH
jgi:transcriptional regulator with XRE-family HTH domain